MARQTLPYHRSVPRSSPCHPSRRAIMHSVAQAFRRTREIGAGKSVSFGEKNETVLDLKLVYKKCYEYIRASCTLAAVTIALICIYHPRTPLHHGGGARQGDRRHSPNSIPKLRTWLGTKMTPAERTSLNKRKPPSRAAPPIPASAAT